MTGLCSRNYEKKRAWAEVDLGAIRNNVAYLEGVIGPKTMLMAVVKADAYGHGAIAVTKACLDCGVRRFAVATVEEGVRLRRAGVCTPILVFGVPDPKDFESFFRWNLTVTVPDWQSAQRLSHSAQSLGHRLNVHLKLDTGMGRLGVLYTNGPDFVEKVANLPGLIVEGVYTHLSTADSDTVHATRQISRFVDVIGAISARGIEIPCYHMASSAGAIDYPDSRLNMVRVGLALYGLYPEPQLVPALSWKAKLSEIKEVPPGWGIGYGQTYTTKAKTRIGVLPVGYADGYTRRLKGKAKVLIGGRPYPVVGNICMDQLMVDLGSDPVGVDDEVVLIGTQGNNRISAQDLANWSDTISYEIVCAIGPRIPRLYTSKDTIPMRPA
jgi:alanine racemase